MKNISKYMRGILLAGFIVVMAGAVNSGVLIKSGQFSVLTYNVAGLPNLMSASEPYRYIPRISPKLNAFDIVLAQEDFYYHDKLVSKANHKYKSGTTRNEKMLGDGLSRFSIFPMTKVTHIAWEECHGRYWYSNDCMTKKGFSMATHTIAPSVEIDIYNLHMDAGPDIKDNRARDFEMDQLIEYMSVHSKGKAVIIGGDWNLAGNSDADLKLLERIINKQGLTDSCRFHNCGVERLDRILFRSNDRVKLTSVKYTAEKKRFENGKGGQLSDHIAVSTVFEWNTIATEN